MKRAFGYPNICSTRHLIIGIPWKENDHPIEGAIHSCLNYYPGILHLIQLAPAHLSSFLIEAHSSLSKILQHPHKSPWNMRFQIRRIEDALKNFQILFVNLHPTTVRFNKKLEETNWHHLISQMWR